jgi:UV DNA damage endonuclease
MIVKSINEKGFNVLNEKIIQNLKDLIIMIDWNENNGIKVFRLSSEMFPHITNQKIGGYEINEDMIKLLKKAGKNAKIYNQRLTFHPGQYNVVGSPREEVFNQTIKELKYHADILDIMEMGNDSVIVIHGGGLYGNKEETIERWCNQFNLLPENVQKRLVLENCEKCYSIEDCLRISSIVNIPVVFDTHHYNCYKELHPNIILKDQCQYIPDILESWNRRNIKPKFHISEQGCGRIGHHSDFIETIPDYLLEIPYKYNVDIDIMIEAKMKEQAIFKLYKKYPELNCKKKCYLKKKESSNNITTF